MEIRGLLIALGLLILSSTNVIAQNNFTPHRISQVRAAYYTGTSGDSYFFAYNSLIQLEIAHGQRFSDRFAVLGSVGVEENKDGWILPLAINLHSRLGRNRQQIMQFQLGYGVGFRAARHADYRYVGGLVGGLGYGFQLFQIKQTQVIAAFTYQFRRSGLRHQPFGTGQEIRQSLDNHYFGVRTALEF